MASQEAGRLTAHYLYNVMQRQSLMDKKSYMKSERIISYIVGKQALPGHQRKGMES